MQADLQKDQAGSTYTYCMNSVNMLLFVPIAVAFAGGENTEAELHSRFFLFSYIRSGRKQYLVGKQQDCWSPEVDSFFSHGVPSCNLYTEVRSVSFSD